MDRALAGTRTVCALGNSVVTFPRSAALGPLSLNPPSWNPFSS